MPLASSADVLPGDVDGNGFVNIGDLTELIDLLLNNQTDVGLYPAADVDGNGAISIDDVTELIDVLLNTKYHEWVDLGLPSGTLWATCNVGAESPEEYGDYFAWGETEPKSVYDWSTYKWCNGSEFTLTKYCTYSSDGYNGFVDSKTELDPEDDAAYVNWGPSWRMPTVEQLAELCNNCTWTWTQRNGEDCEMVTGPNGNTLFLPAQGQRWNESLDYEGWKGFYWSRTLLNGSSRHARIIHFGNGWGSITNIGRCYGFPVRAVRVSQN